MLLPAFLYHQFRKTWQRVHKDLRNFTTRMRKNPRSKVDESGFPALLKVRCALPDVASTLILPPLPSIGDELWPTMHLSKETQESAWSQRLEDRNLNSLLLHHFWTTEDSTTTDQWHSFAGERFSSLSPSSFALPLQLFETISGNIWQLIRTSTAIFRTWTLHSVTEVFAFWRLYFFIINVVLFLLYFVNN